MAGSALADPPSVSLSFANNFWGKDDAGVGPLLERMHNAKVTGDEMKAFYTARAHIEEEYARKLLNLSRKPLGSSEAGTLKLSLDVVRAEMESMGKQHQNIAGQMKSELEEQLSAFTGGLKERRKIVQGGIEKLLKVKMQQTAAVNKARDRYEQDCLKIKGYLAQGHMVMGHEERKNKAKLEKTQIQLSGSSQEYEQAVKILEETTARWNREWKKACDNFQDLEEERIDFMKSSLWAFANISSTVCVSDDSSLEKIRLSLEDCEVEKDITGFIRESGTGQEIPDPPKFIDFCRGDAADDASVASEDNNYTVAQFARTMNPAFRSASPQPSLFESHHDPNNPLARELAHKEAGAQPPDTPTSARADPRAVAQAMQEQYQSQYGDIPQIPHNAYPADGMTQFCRIAPPSERSSSIPSPIRPDSRDSRSDLSIPTSFTSADPASGGVSPVKQMEEPVEPPTAAPRERAVLKKKSGFFQNHSPFKRKGNKDEAGSPAPAAPASRNTWAAPSARDGSRPPYGRQSRATILGADRASASPEPDAEPVDPRANFQLNVGKNVFDVASPDKQKKQSSNSGADESDPIAQALAELKGVTKQSSLRMTADRYVGLSTPAPPGTPGNVAPLSTGGAQSSQREPPPSYDQPMSRLGAPQPAHTAKQMQQTTQSYVKQTQNMFNPRASGGSSRPSTRGSQDPRAASPAPPRAISPRPALNNRAASPNPYAGGGNRPRAQSNSPIKPRDGYGSWNSRHGSPGNVPRAVSPQPQFSRPGTRGGATSPAPHFGGQQRPGSSAGGAMVLAPSQNEGGGSTYGGSQRTGRSTTRPMSYYGGGSTGGADFGGGQGQLSTRVRSRSVAADTRFTKDGRPIMHYSRAMYMYQAQIPEELSFAKGDILAVTREQDDGWWEAEVTSKPGRIGLVPSNYLQNC